MTPDDLKILNKMYDTISAMCVVINEVASYNCHGRDKMCNQWGELHAAMRELNKPPVQITAEDVKRLREHTGEGLMASKRALVACNGDFNKAVEYLRMGR